MQSVLASNLTTRGVVTLAEPVGKLLKLGVQRTGAGDVAGGVEAIAGACVLDVQRFQQRFLADATTAGVVADLYAGALQRGGLIAARPSRESFDAPVGRPLRVGYFLWSLTPGQAASKRITRLVELHDRAVVEPSVIITEDLCAREPRTTTLVLEDAPSERIGAAMLARMRATGARVDVVPRTGSHVDGGLAAARIAREHGLDVAVFVGGPTSPVQVVCAAQRVAPLQVNLNVGVPMLSPGIDAVIYTNPLRRTGDTGVLKTRGIASWGVACSGCDAQRAGDAIEADRAALGLPARSSGAVVLVTASNKLPMRLGEGTFAADLAKFMVAHKQVRWVGIGRGDVAAALLPLVRAGVRDRVVLTGGLDDIAPVVKACDVYLNEYPEGGYNTVVESMAAGVPVVAMSATARHADSAGAQLVGSPDGLMKPDLSAYWSLAERWVNDPAARAEAGERQRARALSEYDYAAVCRTYEQMFCAGLAEVASLGRTPVGA